MRIDWLTLAAATLVVLGHLPHARGQWGAGSHRSQREVRSLFGSRSLGFPVGPKPRDFGGGGAFGPRPNLRRGFSPIPDVARWEDAAPEPAAPYQDNLQLGQTTPQPARPVAEWGESVGQFDEQQPPRVERAEQAAGQTGEGVDETAQVVAGPGEPVTQPEAIVGTGGPGLGSGTTGEAATAATSVAEPRRPSFQWNTDAIRRLPADVVLAERLRRVLTDRLRSPLEVSIRHETAILRGMVTSEHDRILAGHLARFEPGVRTVRNELTVAAASSGPSAEIRISPKSPD